MAGRRQAQPKIEPGALPVDDYRHPEATRPNNPPAALAAEGRTPAVPRATYAYSPRLTPSLRSGPSSHGRGATTFQDRKMAHPTGLTIP